MSNKVSVLVYSRRVGSPIRKAVLVYFAERASDNGEGIWASKSTIAEAIECGRSTVIRTINDFVAEGILMQVGTRRHRNGETVEYAMNLRVIEGLPEASSDLSRSKTSPRAEPVPERDPSRSGTLPVPERDPYPSRSGTQTTIRTIIEPPEEDHSDHLFDDLPVSRFEDFWGRWPMGKVGKQKARAAFQRLSAQNRKLATDRVSQWAADWRRSNPTANDMHPTTYLSGKRWEDDFTPSQPRLVAAGGQRMTSRWGIL